MADEGYEGWSNEKLIERVTELERELKAKNEFFKQNRPNPKVYKRSRQEREFDPSKYSTRLVAFKLAYLGKNYNGFEYHTNNPTPLPTIEEELWKAFTRTRLIFPKGSDPLRPGEINWEGCDYSKCGRTDKGVSAFGQVIGIRVRSNRPLPRRKLPVTQEVNGHSAAEDFSNTSSTPGGLELASPALGPRRSEEEQLVEELNLEDEDLAEALDFDPVADEIPYASVLNRILPPDIRILAWCPAPPLEFSARFSCRERQYKYFFTQPVFAPAPTSVEDPQSTDAVKDGWLDIEAMREAAKRFEGLHDFRNFCKVDGGKQITNFQRRMFQADIEEVDDSTAALGFVNGKGFGFDKLTEKVKSGSYPKLYTFTLHGSAFLWHQVRHMVAILFLVGQGLESPSLVSELLDTLKNDRRPLYEMAEDTPLVLWNCVFPNEDDPERRDVMQWHYVGDGLNCGDAKYGSSGLMENLWEVWRERKLDEVLAGSLLDIVSKHGQDVDNLTSPAKKGGKRQKVFDGGNAPRLQGRYTPVMKRPLLDSIEVINETYLVRKGFESADDMRNYNHGFKKLKDISGLLDLKDL